ncbi:hypothetical protein PoB_004667300 [Plakobranchus ocellatus]|uniref:Uncharacterized protein n=1 Tax=Plakobranchus ocellatus TaxID=259542 RepID=A0AAV4BKR6_9GAST|nr:hypothetical protein PoB_004667300 [Plakobranchus ocellatus]
MLKELGVGDRRWKGSGDKGRRGRTLRKLPKKNQYVRLAEMEEKQTENKKPVQVTGLEPTSSQDKFAISCATNAP